MFKLVFKTVALCVCFSVTLSKDVVPTSVVRHINSSTVNKDKPIHATYNASCGGIIESKLDAVIVLEYKPDEEYDNNEMCIWTIRNDEAYDLLITKTKSNFEVGYDYLQVSSFGPATGGGPSSTHQMGSTASMEQANSNGNVVFVIFSSDSSNTGTGFRLEMIGYNERNPHYLYNDFHSTSPIGTASYRDYLERTMTSFVIAPPLTSISSLVLDVDYLTEPPLDYVSVYQLERNGRSIHFREDGRLSGSGNISFTAMYYTTYVVFLKTARIPNGGVENGGVTLNWHVPNYAQAKSENSKT